MDDQEPDQLADKARNRPPPGPVSPPDELRGFPGTFRVRGKTPYAGGVRRRWKDDDGKIYEWDYRHGRVEVYDSRGRHLRECDADTGRELKGPDPDKRVEP